MHKIARSSVIALSASLALVGASAGAASAQQQRGLVNVNVSDIETGDILSRNNVAVGVAANLVANVCPALSVGNVAVLATQAVRSGESTTEANCDGDAALEDVSITQSS